MTMEKYNRIEFLRNRSLSKMEEHYALRMEELVS